MRSSLLLGTLSLTLIAGLSACGDDGGGAGAGGNSATGTDTDATTDTAPATTNTNLTTDGGETGSTSLDTSDTSSGGDESTTSGDETTGGVVVPDCEMGYSTLVSADNTLVTNLSVVSDLVNCDKPIEIVATGGTVCANDDGNGGYFYTLEVITFEDFEPTQCGLAMLGLSDLSIANIGTSEEVVIPQAGGDMVGNQSIEVLGVAGGSAPIIGVLDPTPLEGFIGILPEGTATAEADTTTVTYVDTTTIIAVGTPMVGGQDLTVTLMGFTGSLTFEM